MKWISIILDQSGIKKYQSFGFGIWADIHKHMYGDSDNFKFPFHFHLGITIAFWFIEIQIGNDIIDKKDNS